MSIDIGYLKSNAMEILPPLMKTERMQSSYSDFFPFEPDFSEQIFQVYGKSWLTKLKLIPVL